MNRIDAKFRELAARREKALILFITAGDPSLKKNEELALAFEKEGVDFLEIGVPFSDPMADGPVIQAASMRSLAKKTNLRQILELVRRIRRRSELPLLLMSYLNPVLRYGLERFAKDAKAAGVDGLIFPELPPDEGREISATMTKHGIHVVYLLAPTSPPDRVKLVTRASRGFVYYVSITGVTGAARQKAAPSIVEHLSKARKVSKLPVCVGFGVSTPGDAARMGKISDGVIVGSAIVKAIDANPKLSAGAFAAKFVRPLAAALGKRRS